MLITAMISINYRLFYLDIVIPTISCFITLIRLYLARAPISLLRFYSLSFFLVFFSHPVYFWNISSDKPGPTSITYEPRQVVKKHPLSITCFVLDPGRPKVSGFKWLRGWHRLPDENDATLFIESVNLETETNFTCLAYNDAGDGDPATTFIDVSGKRHMSMHPVTTYNRQFNELRNNISKPDQQRYLRF